MANDFKQDRTRAELLYNVWRKHADLAGCATYSWDGMTENYRTAWTLLAVSLDMQTKVTTNRVARQCREEIEECPF